MQMVLIASLLYIDRSMMYHRDVEESVQSVVLIVEHKHHPILSIEKMVYLLLHGNHVGRPQDVCQHFELIIF
jgi:ABC-type branched-subunit amino acid transport system ATPase component